MKQAIFFLFLVLMAQAVFAMGQVEPTIETSVSDGKSTIIMGVIYDVNTYMGVNGVPVDVYCGNTFIGTVTTAYNGGFGDGYYSKISDNDACNPGNLAYVMVGSAKSDSSVIIWHATKDWGFVPPFGVPEYSLVTLGMAVAAGGLGFVMLRRKN
jgi:hypothetical protein